MSSFSSGFFSAGDNADCFTLISGKRHSSARFLHDAAGQRTLVAAGSSDVFSNTVGVWDLSRIIACQENGALLSDYGCYEIDGAVMCLEFCESNYPDHVCPLWVGTSNGHVRLLGSPSSMHECEMQLSHLQTARSTLKGGNQPLHSSAVSAIAVHANSESALSAGEDGRVFELTTDEAGKIIVSAWPELLDWIALYDIKYGGDGTNFFTAGATGQVKMWDTRSHTKPKAFANLDLGTKYISVEPFKRADPARGRGGRENLLLAGGEDGEISIFDIRQERDPLVHTYGPHGTNEATHTAEVWSIRGNFQRSPIGTFYSCSNDGTILAFYASASAAGGGSSGEPALQIEGWYRFHQAVSSVDAVLLDEGLREERTLLLGATDGGLLLAVVYTDQPSPEFDSNMWRR